VAGLAAVQGLVGQAGLDGDEDDRGGDAVVQFVGEPQPSGGGRRGFLARQQAGRQGGRWRGGGWRHYRSQMPVAAAARA
jgi:hypothetical protein